MMISNVAIGATFSLLQSAFLSNAVPAKDFS